MHAGRIWQRGGQWHASFAALFVRAAARRRRTASTIHERGFALLIVLVALACLSLLWGAVLATTRQSTSDATARLAALRLKGASDGALATIAFELSRPHARIDGTRYYQIGSVEVTVHVRPEAAKLDLNDADPAFISQLLYASGLSEAASFRLARQIADVRSRDDSGYHGVSGNPYPGHLETLTDVIPGIHDGSDLVACLGSDVTLYTRSPDVALQWASGRMRQAAIAFDPRLDAHTGSVFNSVVGGAASRPTIFEVTERARDPTTQIRMTRQVVIRLTGNPNQLYWIISDQSPAPTVESSAAACERLAKAGN